MAEFLGTCNSTPAAWGRTRPRPSTTTPPRAGPGSSRWTGPASGPHPHGRRRPPPFSATGTAEELLLFVWGRLTLSDLHIEGDKQVLEHLIAWEPEE
ncbi:hypothetical protein G6W53_23630 [Streptomyces sp. KAI 90]|nr:hypothetical protein [Streptomyces sp. KAI 90]